MSRKSPLASIVLLALSTFPLTAVELTGRYALVLQDDPAAKAMPKAAHRDGLEVVSARRSIVQKQASLKTQLATQGFKVTGSTNTLLNAVYVIAKSSDVAALRALPGVKYVALMRRVKPNLDKAVQLIDAPNAWTALGGIPGAGTGMKIAIIDTGIDQTHPAFQDSSLQVPSGYPICDIPANCAYTNSKVIVARSYVSGDAAGTGPTDSFPDDLTPRDRVGHGTAVAMCAGGNTNAGPLATITGLAPHAWLGNYKVFGSPGINDGATEDVLIQAVEDAFNDGMDVANLSSGGPAFSGPLDSGEVCGNPAGSPCDPEVAAIETAIQGNMIVVVAAGNDGGDSPTTNTTLNTIDSPAYAPDAIAVAASENSREFLPAVNVAGPSVPSNLVTIAANEGDGPVPNGTLTAALVDAGKIGDAYGCAAFPAGGFNNAIALIERGASSGTSCSFETKVDNANNAGAIGVVIFDNVNETPTLVPGGLGNTGIPAFGIGNTDGLALRTYVDANSGVTAAMNPNGIATSDTDVNSITYFSSRGPVIETSALKPDVAAPGEYIYMAAQDLDPNGELYDPSRYTVSQGTSFSTPMVAGIAALVRQKNPGMTATQVKSAIVNTATSDTNDPWTRTTPSTVLAVGGGKVEALNAISTNVTTVPSTLSFGALQTGFTSGSQNFVVTNTGTGSLTLALAVTRTVADSNTTLTVSEPSLTLAAGASSTVNLTLSGSRPAPGEYEGAVTITGGAKPVHIPYLYLVSDGVPANMYALAGDQDSGFPGQVNYEGGAFIKVIDQYGLGVPNVPITWTALDGGSIANGADTTTDVNGIAGAGTTMGTTPAIYTFAANISGTSQRYVFTDYAYAQAVIATKGVVNAATNVIGSGIAPGSYVSIYGNNLATFSQGATYVPLPISIYYISVGFDGTGVSVPAPLSYVSPTQVNIQVPWELAGQSSVDVKVNNEPLNGALLSGIPVTTYAPGLFEVNGQAAATNLSGSLIDSSNPAIPGQYIVLYCNGLGPVTNQPATGAVALGSPLSLTQAQPTVTIGGQPATVNFSGLAPGYVGLYQLNVLVPSGVSGTVQVALSIGGVSAPGVPIVVQ